jgi:hypothetical protein
VLVITGRSDTVQGTVETLGETGAAYAFVSGILSLAPAL